MFGMPMQRTKKKYKNCYSLIICLKQCTMFWILFRPHKMHLHYEKLPENSEKIHFILFYFSLLFFFRVCCCLWLTHACCTALSISRWYRIITWCITFYTWFSNNTSNTLQTSTRIICICPFSATFISFTTKNAFCT